MPCDTWAGSHIESAACHIYGCPCACRSMPDNPWTRQHIESAVCHMNNTSCAARCSGSSLQCYIISKRNVCGGVAYRKHINCDYSILRYCPHTAPADKSDIGIGKIKCPIFGNFLICIERYDVSSCRCDWSKRKVEVVKAAYWLACGKAADGYGRGLFPLRIQRYISKNRRTKIIKNC
jgi:hypothetical protein